MPAPPRALASLAAALLAAAPAAAVPAYFEGTAATQHEDNVLRWSVTTTTLAGTEVQVRWRPAHVRGWRYTRCTPTGRRHRVELWGMRAETAYDFQVIDCASGRTDEAGSFTTEPLPDGLPRLSLEEPCSGCATRYVLFQAQGADEDGGPTRDLVIADTRGDVVWYQHDTGVQAYTWTEDDTLLYVKDYNEVIELALSGEEIRHWYRLGENSGRSSYLDRDRCFHHDIAAAGGRIWLLGAHLVDEEQSFLDESLLAYDATFAREGELVAAMDGMLQAVLPELPGAPTPEEIGYQDSNRYGANACFFGSQAYGDWGHVNAFEVTPYGEFLISSRVFHLEPTTEPVGAILALDRDGALRWAIGAQSPGEGASACLATTCTNCRRNVWFGQQHHPRVTAYDGEQVERLWIYDNEPSSEDPDTSYQSRVIEVALDHSPDLDDCPVRVDIVNEVSLGTTCGPVGSAYEVAEGRILTHCYTSGDIWETTWGRSGDWSGVVRWRLHVDSPVDDGDSGFFRAIPIEELPLP